DKAISSSAERVFAGQTPEQPDWREDRREKDRQQHSGVHMTERSREPPPGGARPLQQRRTPQTAEQQHNDARSHHSSARRSGSPPEERSDHAQDDADRYPERSLGVPGTFCHQWAPRRWLPISS